MNLCEREVTIKGSGHQKNIAPRRKRKRVIDFDDRVSYLKSARENEIDVDYKKHLLMLEASIEQGKENNVETVADDEDDYDPHYKLFFENLKPRGNAYVLVVAKRNGNLVVKYEYKDEDELQSTDELRRKAPYCSKKPSRINGHGLGPLDADLPDPEIKRGTRLVDGSKNELRASNGLRRKASHRCKKSSRNNAELPEQGVLLGMRHDGRGKTWSEHFNAFKVEGVSFFYVEKDGNQFVYEKSTDESSSDYDAREPAELPLSDGEEAPRTGKISLGTSDKVAPMNRKSTGKTPDVKGSDKHPLIGGQKAQKTGKKTLGKSDMIAPLVQKSIRNASDTKGSAKLPLIRGKKTPEASKKTPGISDIKICLSSQKSIGKKPVAEGPAKFPLSSEKTPETRMETLETFDNIAPSYEKSVGSSSNGFRQGVMEILAKPYDSEEHEHLLREAKIRRRILRYKETRGTRLNPYKDEEAWGESYLDHHKELFMLVFTIRRCLAESFADLKKKIKAARRNGSSHEVLYLLRALFFWLQNLCHIDERFIPWKDELWLEAMQKACKTKD